MRIFPHFKLPAIKLPAVHPAVNAAGLATVVANAAAFALTPQGQDVMHGSMTAHNAQVASLIAGGVLAFLPAKKPPQATPSDMSHALGETTMNGLNIDLSSVTTGLEDALEFLAGKPVVVPVQPQQIKLAGYDVQVSLGANSIQVQYLGKATEAAAPAPAAAVHAVVTAAESAAHATATDANA